MVLNKFGLRAAVSVIVSINEGIDSIMFMMCMMMVFVCLLSILDRYLSSELIIFVMVIMINLVRIDCWLLISMWLNRLCFILLVLN